MTALEENGIHDMRPAYGFVIRAVRAEQPTVGRLAELLDSTKQNASKLVDGMVQAKLLARVADPEDARRTRLRLTAKGERVYRTAIATSEALERHLRLQVGDGATRGLRRALTQVVEGDGSLEDVLARRARPVW
jgi:DNA-binding MarR family transcriptional regulator